MADLLDSLSESNSLAKSSAPLPASLSGMVNSVSSQANAFASSIGSSVSGVASSMTSQAASMSKALSAPTVVGSQIATQAPPSIEEQSSSKSGTYKVRVSCGSEEIVFEASAPVSESRTVNYEGYNIVHLPTDLWAYRNTSGRKFNIQGKFVSRNADEARKNAHYLNLIRSWLLPDFGESGATPPILRFSAYYHQNLTNIEVILRSYSFSFPDDVDWIFQNVLEPMPVIMTVNIDLDEAYSAEEITAKAWKIKLPGQGGKFIGGAGPSFTGMGGMSSTPNISDMAQSSGFPGLASPGIIGNGNTLNSINSTVSNMIGGTSTSFGNPVNMCAADSSIYNGMGSVTSSESYLAAGQQSISNSSIVISGTPQETSNDFGRITNLKVDQPVIV